MTKDDVLEARRIFKVKQAECEAAEKLYEVTRSHYLAEHAQYKVDDIVEAMNGLLYRICEVRPIFWDKDERRGGDPADVEIYYRAVQQKKGGGDRLKSAWGNVKRAVVSIDEDQICRKLTVSGQ